MPRVGFEPTISAGERPKTNALDRAATGTGYRPILTWRIARGYLWQFYSWYTVTVELLLHVQCAPELGLFGIENLHYFENITFLDL